MFSGSGKISSRFLCLYLLCSSASSLFCVQRFMDSSLSSLPAPASFFSEIISGKMSRVPVLWVILTAWSQMKVLWLSPVCSAECCKLAQPEISCSGAAWPREGSDLTKHSESSAPLLPGTHFNWGTKRYIFYTMFNLNCLCP